MHQGIDASTHRCVNVIDASMGCSRGLDASMRCIDASVHRIDDINASMHPMHQRINVNVDINVDINVNEVNVNEVNVNASLGLVKPRLSIDALMLRCIDALMR